jgi:hypothetical protein
LSTDDSMPVVHSWSIQMQLSTIVSNTRQQSQQTVGRSGSRGSVGCWTSTTVRPPELWADYWHPVG